MYNIHMKDFFTFLTDALYYGFWLTTPLLLILQAKIKFLDFKTLVTCNNTLLLIWTIACYLKIGFYLLEYLIAYFDGPSYMQYSFTGLTNGFPLLLAFIRLTIPLLFVSKKMRTSIRIASLILGSWLAILFYQLTSSNLWVHFNISLIKLLFQVLLYFALLLLTYVTIQKRRKR